MNVPMTWRTEGSSNSVHSSKHCHSSSASKGASPCLGCPFYVMASSTTPCGKRVDVDEFTIVCRRCRGDLWLVNAS